VITDKDLGIFEKSDWVRGISISFANAQSVEVLEVTALKEYLEPDAKNLGLRRLFFLWR
jgi:hypothetical protein